MPVEYQANGTPVWVDEHGRVSPVEFDDQGQAHPQAQAVAPATRTPWNAREQQAVAMDTLNRRLAQNAMPGFGVIAEPIGNMLGDPRQRAALGRNIQGAVDMVRQIPNLNLPRLASDTFAAGQRAVADLPNVPGRIATHLPQIIEGMTTAPFIANDEARNQEIVNAMRGNEAGANRAAEQAVGSVGGIATNIAGTALGPLARTPLQAAGLGAALTLPNSLANGQGSLQERLPQALVDTAGGAAIGAGLPLLARNARPRTPTGAATNVEDGVGAPHGQANRGTPASRLRDFETAGVRPTLAATVEGTPAGVTKTISENWLGGFTARNGLQNSIEDTANRVHEMARRVGEVQNPELAGEAVQAGVQRFAGHAEMPQPYAGDPARIPVRDWSFPAKAEALYNRAFDQLQADESAMRGQVEGPVVTVDNTLRAIDGLNSRVSGDASRTVLGASPFLERMAQAMRHDMATNGLSFRDLRTWRTRLRAMMTDNTLRGDTESGALRQVYGALTRDISATAQNIGGQAAVDLPKIDRWYRMHSQAVESALEPFNNGGGRQAYQRIIALASNGSRQNTTQLRQLANRLRPDEMRTVGATLLDEMGSPTPGRAGALEPGAFSAASFATNWARLSEAGKAALFPPELRRELDALGRVADYQRQVEAMSNHSGTMRSGQNIATGAALFGANAMHALPFAVGGLAAMNLTGEMLTNPRFVRWLTHAAQARADGAGVRRSLAALRRLAARDPALIPAYNHIVRAQPASAPDQQAQLQPAQ